MVPSRDGVYMVVMVLGVASDMQVIRGLLDRDFGYFGVLGNRAKLATSFAICEMKDWTRPSRSQ